MTFGSGPVGRESTLVLTYFVFLLVNFKYSVSNFMAKKTIVNKCIQIYFENFSSLGLYFFNYKKSFLLKLFKISKLLLNKSNVKFPTTRFS